MAHSRRRHLHGQELPRSQGIETTQRYLHFVPGHAEQSVRSAQVAEQKELEEMAAKDGRHLGDTALNHLGVRAGIIALTH